MKDMAIVTFVQLSEAVFCEASYCQYRNACLIQKTHPSTRGAPFLDLLARQIDAMQEELDEAIEKRRIVVASS